MAIKLDDIASWKLVPNGEALMLAGSGDDARRVRVDLNVEDKTWLYVSSVDLVVKDQFLAAVGPGLETVEFYAAGDLALSFAPASPDGKGSQVWVYTAEIDPNVAEVPDAVSFTEMHQRRARNPELEMMQLLARQNERRMDEKLAQMEAWMAEREERNVVNEEQAPAPARGAGDRAESGSGVVSGVDGADSGGGDGDGDDDAAAG